MKIKTQAVFNIIMILTMQTAFSAPVDYFDISSNLAPQSRLETQDTGIQPGSNILILIGKRYWLPLTLIIATGIAISLMTLEWNFWLAGAVKLAYGIIIFLFGDLLAQKVAAKNVDYYSRDRTLYMIPVSIVSRFMQFIWLNILINYLFNLLADSWMITILGETLARTLLDQLIFAVPYYIILLTMKNYLSCLTPENKGIIWFQFRNKMKESFIPARLGIKNILFSPAGVLLTGDLLFAGTFMFIIFTFFPQTAFIPAVIGNVFMASILSYLMHIQEDTLQYKISSPIVNEFENLLKTKNLSDTEIDAVMDAVNRIKLRNYLIQLFVTWRGPANLLVKQEQFEEDIAKLKEWLSITNPELAAA